MTSSQAKRIVVVMGVAMVVAMVVATVVVTVVVVVVVKPVLICPHITWALAMAKARARACTTATMFMKRWSGQLLPRPRPPLPPRLTLLPLR